MSKYSTLKAEIIASIKRNGAQAITGDLLQEKLLAMIDSLGEFYQFGGLVSHDTEFTAGDEPVVFIAATPGTYTNFGGLVVADGEVALLVWSGSAWSKQTTDIATRSEVSQLGQKINGFNWASGDFVNTAFDGTNNAYLTNGDTYYNPNLYHIGKIYVKKGDKLAMRLYVSSAELMIAAYNSNGELVLLNSVVGTSSAENVIYTVPDGIDSVRIFSANNSIFPSPTVEYLNSVDDTIKENRSGINSSQIDLDLFEGINITTEDMSTEPIVHGWNYVNSSYYWNYNNTVYHSVIPTREGLQYSYRAQSIHNCLIIIAFDSDLNIIESACVSGDNQSVSSGTYTTPINVAYIMFCSRTDIMRPYLFVVGKGMMIDDSKRVQISYDSNGKVTGIVETSFDGVTRTKSITYNSSGQVSAINTVGSNRINSSETITYSNGKVTEINITVTK